MNTIWPLPAPLLPAPCSAGPVIHFSTSLLSSPNGRRLRGCRHVWSGQVSHLVWINPPGDLRFGSRGPRKYLGAATVTSATPLFMCRTPGLVTRAAALPVPRLPPFRPLLGNPYVCTTATFGSAEIQYTYSHSRFNFL